MALILSFHRPGQRRKPARPSLAPTSAQIIFFPGVRYERMADVMPKPETSTAAAPKARAPRKNNAPAKNTPATPASSTPRRSRKNSA